MFDETNKRRPRSSSPGRGAGDVVRTSTALSSARNCSRLGVDVLDGKKGGVAVLLVVDAVSSVRKPSVAVTSVADEGMPSVSFDRMG